MAAWRRIGSYGAPSIGGLQQGEDNLQLLVLHWSPLNQLPTLSPLKLRYGHPRLLPQLPSLHAAQRCGDGLVPPTPFADPRRACIRAVVPSLDSAATPIARDGRWRHRAGAPAQ